LAGESKCPGGKCSATTPNGGGCSVCCESGTKAACSYGTVAACQCQ
jgi:hypothetical protein